jgi:hypothetical protein
VIRKKDEQTTQEEVTAMTVSEILSLCCSTDPYKRHQHRPWRVGEWVYATDGHVLVRVSAEFAPEVGPFVAPVEPARWEETAPDCEALLAAAAHDPSDVLPMPDLPPIRMVKCNTCDGMGRYKVCDECDGTGRVEWDSGRHTYDAECQECDGRQGNGCQEGGVECEDCGGTGSVPDDNSNTLIRVGPWRIRITEARKLAAIGAEIAATNNSGGWLTPVLWRSGDCIGLFMPQEDE